MAESQPEQRKETAPQGSSSDGASGLEPGIRQLSPEELAEVRWLRNTSLAVLVMLVFGGVASTVLILMLMAGADTSETGVPQIPPIAMNSSVVASAEATTAAGWLGACVAAAMSVAQRRSNGWELNLGQKIPLGATGETFNRRMVPYFLLRPFLGAAFGLFGYCAILSGTLLTIGRPSASSGGSPTSASGDPLQMLGLIAVGFLFGLFSKSLHEKLSQGFKAFMKA